MRGMTKHLVFLILSLKAISHKKKTQMQLLKIASQTIQDALFPLFISFSEQILRNFKFISLCSEWVPSELETLKTSH